ncbi:hypothetical protein D6783_01750 [Candidatus Woesearchaeota archaeon]|nr:MAG: hypothetical protein D6783_01750 [Candidatus Woesearchaeota archaeon]
MALRLVHRLKGGVLQKEVASCGVCLSNKKGNYFAFSLPANVTHYEGFFHFDAEAWQPFKVIESLSLGLPVVEVEKQASLVVRRSGRASETFLLSSNALLYEVAGFQGSVRLELDMRYVHDFDPWGRHFDVHEEEGLVVVRYEKSGQSGGAVPSGSGYEGFLAIGSPDGIVALERAGRWVRKERSFDEARGAATVDFVYHAGGLLVEGGKRFVFAFSKSREKAVKKVRYVLDRYELIRENLVQSGEQMLSRRSVVGNVALKALDDLTVLIKGGVQGIFAGLPWFFQFYARDEAVSLRAKLLEGRFLLVKEVVFRYLERILPSGQVPNRHPPSLVGSIDAAGWLFKRVEDAVRYLWSHGLLQDYFSRIELAYLRDRLEVVIERLRSSSLQEGLVWSAPQETWMDTTGGVDDGRLGACIEVQALMLVLYRCVRLLYKVTKKGNGKEYRQYERELAGEVRRRFFDGRRLADRVVQGGVDWTARPNAFLAGYLYPELLPEREWGKVVKWLLGSLWLEWGGLASIAKNHPLFCAEHSGEDDRSYHRGDSWFFCNNLAGVFLHRLDAAGFGGFVRKIRDASVEELLFSGWAGHCAEVSSAARLESRGCLAQAWSAATLIELLDALGEW